MIIGQRAPASTEEGEALFLSPYRPLWDWLGFWRHFLWLPVAASQWPRLLEFASPRPSGDAGCCACTANPDADSAAVGRGMWRAATALVGLDEPGFFRIHESR